MPIVGWGSVRFAIKTAFLPMNPMTFVSVYQSTHLNYGRKLRYDENTFYHADIDITLQCLLRHRIVFIDKRFYFEHGGVESNMGGAQADRTHDRVMKSRAHLVQKWGKYVRDRKPTIVNASKYRTTTLTAGVAVRRRSTLGYKG